MKKLLFITILSSFTLLAACSETSEPKKVADSASTEAKEEKPKEETKTEFNVGEKIELEGTMLTVSKVEKSKGSEFETPKEGSEYVIVHLDIENGSEENISYNPFDYTLQNSQGQVVDSTFSMVNEDSALESGELTPKGKVSGSVIFEAPVGDAGLKLIYTPNMFIDSEKITINLQ